MVLGVVVVGLVSLCVCVCVCVCSFLNYASLFVTGLVIMCFVYCLVVLWLSVPPQLIAWKDSSPK